MLFLVLSETDWWLLQPTVLARIIGFQNSKMKQSNRSNELSIFNVKSIVMCIKCQGCFISVEQFYFPYSSAILMFISASILKVFRKASTISVVEFIIKRLFESNVDLLLKSVNTRFCLTNQLEKEICIYTYFPNQEIDQKFNLKTAMVILTLSHFLICNCPRITNALY